MEAAVPLTETDLRTDEELVTAVVGGEVDGLENTTRKQLSLIHI